MEEENPDKKRGVYHAVLERRRAGTARTACISIPVDDAFIGSVDMRPSGVTPILIG